MGQHVFSLLFLPVVAPLWVQSEDATKRDFQGLARWGKALNLHPLTSSYSSLQGADTSSAWSVIQGPHSKVTCAGFFDTNPSQVAYLLRVGLEECGSEKSGHAGRVVV